MSFNLTVFDNTGEALAELEASVSVAWVLNAATTAEFTLSAEDPKCTERNLRFGNFVLVTHDKLPDWGGYIVQPRTWGSYTATVKAVSGEGLFERAFAPEAGEWEGNAASIYKQAVEVASKRGLNMVEGMVQGKSEKLLVELRSKKLSDIVREAQDATGHEWWLTPDRDGDLVMKAHWRARRGKSSNYAFIEGENLAIERVMEGGNLYNKVTVLGEGADESLRPRVKVENAQSRKLYGVTEYVEQMNTEVRGNLSARANEIIKQDSFPKLKFTGTVVGAGMGQLKVGDDYPVQLNTVGFFYRNRGALGAQIRARVTAMDYASAEEAVTAVFEQEEIVDD